jgi:putative pyruvate formate lyase activating enzyme
VTVDETLIARIDALFSPCMACELRCGAARTQGQVGACGLGADSHVYNRLLHFGEEGPLVPSYTVYLSGCSMACSFCSEAAHLVAPFARPPTDPAAFARKVAPHLGPARNVNFVGGEPSIQLPWIARFVAELENCGTVPPLLCNTNGYMTPEGLEVALGLFSIWVVDLKFGNDRCAQQVSNTDDYDEVLRRNLRALHEAGVDLWVRHLLMPGHLDCCTRPVLAWCAEHLPNARVNVMPAFVPFPHPRNDTWDELDAPQRARGEAILRASGVHRPFFDGRSLTA